MSIFFFSIPGLNLWIEISLSYLSLVYCGLWNHSLVFMTFTVLRAAAQRFCRMLLDLSLCVTFSWLEWDYGALGAILLMQYQGVYTKSWTVLSLKNKIATNFVSKLLSVFTSNSWTECHPAYTIERNYNELDRMDTFCPLYQQKKAGTNSEWLF
jgi:hypothetical protein